MNSLQTTSKAKNYLQMQNFFAGAGFLSPVVMAFFLMNFFPMSFSWKVIELIIYSLFLAWPLALFLMLFFKGEIESGVDIKLLNWAFKITLYLGLLFYLFTFVYSIVARDELIGYYYYFTVPNIVYFGMYLLCFFFLILAIKANDLLINTLRK